MPLHPDFQSTWDLPYTLVQVISKRMLYDSIQQLPKPLEREKWDYPFYVQKHIESIYPSRGQSDGMEIPLDSIE